MSESAFVFPAVPRPQVVRHLNELAVPTSLGWATDAPLYVWPVDEVSGLYQDWEPEDIANLEHAVGQRPGWGVQINYRLSRRLQLLAFAAALLEHGGVAVDDFCGHVWTVAEIKADVLFKGARFGEGPVR